MALALTMPSQKKTDVLCWEVLAPLLKKDVLYKKSSAYCKDYKKASALYKNKKDILYRKTLVHHKYNMQKSFSTTIFSMLALQHI